MAGTAGPPARTLTLDTCMSDQPTPTRLDDPRSHADFDPHLYPGVNRQEAPAPNATERNNRIKLEFLAVYYRLNREHVRLQNLRGQPETEQRRAGELDILRAIERLLVLRDNLEDEYAPLGVIAEPVNRDGFTRDLIVTFGNEDCYGKLRSDLYSITACVPVPLPKGIDFEELAITIEGPGLSPQALYAPSLKNEPCKN
jgi:hypothetical protein